MPVVTKEQHDASVAEILKESPDYVLLRESPASDVKRTEELLEIKEGILPNFICRFRKGEEHCPHCDRHYNVLDLIKTALQSHSKEFLNNVIFGDEYTRGDGGQIPTCYDCGKKGPGPIFYATSSYHCQL